MINEWVMVYINCPLVYLSVYASASIIMIAVIVANVVWVIVTMLPDVLVSLELLKVSDEPQSPVIHLYLASSSGSRDQDIAVLRKIVSLVSFVFCMMHVLTYE